MPNVTKAGRELAWKLNPAIGTTTAINETCSLIARHAVTHHHLQEQLCNGFHNDRGDWNERAEKFVTKRDEQIERRITQLVESLPHTDEGPIGVEFQGDPRGATVKLIMPGSWVKLHDGWAGEGICV